MPPLQAFAREAGEGGGARSSGAGDGGSASALPSASLAYVEKIKAKLQAADGEMERDVCVVSAEEMIDRGVRVPGLWMRGGASRSGVDRKSTTFESPLSLGNLYVSICVVSVNRIRAVTKADFNKGPTL